MPVDSTERLEMLGAALDLLEEGVAVLDAHSHVIYWNDAAAALTGHMRINLLSRPCPSDLYKVAEDHRCVVDPCACGARPYPTNRENAENPDAVNGYAGPRYSGQTYIERGISFARASETDEAGGARGVLVALKHHLGHTLPAMLRNAPLRDSLGRKMGSVLLFRAVEELDAIPHGENVEGIELSRTQAEIEERLEAAFHEWKTLATPFGLLWINIDQAAQMRRTHGRDACEAMLRIVEHRLAQGLRPNEVIGRWGTDEFLVLSHERNAEMLKTHAEHLAGLTRTADFRWWGDRVGLTASIGAAQAVTSDTLSRLMLEAQQAMHTSIYAGGNHVAGGSAAARCNPVTGSQGEPCSR